MEVADINKPFTFRNRIHPWMFALWISFASIIMMFGALTSAYIVKSAAGSWLEFGMPTQFFISTGLILLSSVSLHLAYKSFSGGNKTSYRALLLAACLLGLGFVTFQYLGIKSCLQVVLTLSECKWLFLLLDYRAACPARIRWYSGDHCFFDQCLFATICSY